MKHNNKTIVKRDGSSAIFNKQRIVDAVNKAIISTSLNLPELAKSTADKVETALSQEQKQEQEIFIQDIQSQVESILMKDAPIVARAYIEYRHDRDVAREKGGSLNKEIEGLINQTNTDLLTENANKDGKTLVTQKDLLTGIISKHYAKQQILPKEIAMAHDSGDIHYHDLDYAPFFPMFNCMLVDLENMLTNGIKMGNADIETPTSILKATSITAKIIAQVASHIYGGTTINKIDEVLAPYVTLSHQKHLNNAEEWAINDKEAFAYNQTEAECYDAFESLELFINSQSSGNGQTPFVSFGYGLGTSWESRMIQKAIMNVRIKGLGKDGKTAIFPKLLFTIKAGLNRKPGDPNYDIKQLALKCASRRMYPDILNYDKVVDVTGSFKAPMGCRSFLGQYIENGKEVHEGRNNMGVVSLNLPRIALQAGGSEEMFYKILDERLNLAKRALETRIERLKTVKASVAPILYTQGACGVRLNPDDYVFDIFKHGRASISLGYIGIHETVKALFNDKKHLFDNKTLQAKSLNILKTLKAAVNQWTKESDFEYSLYATPSENLCGRFCNLDKAMFGNVPGVTDKGYYTNSFHLDVAKKVNPYDKIDFEAPNIPFSSGGFIVYCEFPNMKNNLKALEDVWDYSYSRVPYYGTNTPIDKCHVCGFGGEFEAKSKGYVCPSCGNSDGTKMEVTRRVCGYLGNCETRDLNKAKKIELITRVKHLPGAIS